MTVEWREDTEGLDWAEVAELFRIAPLGERDPESLALVFANSLYKCLAFDGGRLIGAGRVLADGADCAYLCDVVVHPDHQGTGIGKEIVSRLLERSRSHKKIIIYAVPGKEPFYERFGFRRMTTAMAIFEDPEGMEARGYLLGCKT